jgi:16S rRNA (guanine527-N7)-methyltransferase
VSDTHCDSLPDALQHYDLAIPQQQVDRLDRYCRLLWDWNQKLNLTRHTDYEKFVTRDVVDSLELAKLLQPGERVLDMGTGGGVPGVILSIVRPDLQVSLCESVAKRATAVEKIVSDLQLSVPVHHLRAEDVLQQHDYDAVVARAISPLWKILRWLAPHWPSAGRMLLVKGSRWTQERHEARQHGLLAGLELRCAARYTTPASKAENVILRICPKKTTASE